MESNNATFICTSKDKLKFQRVNKKIQRKSLLFTKSKKGVKRKLIKYYLVKCEL